MNHTDKEKLIKADIASIENRVRHAFNQGYALGYMEGKEKAKSQESVLNNIRAEIADLDDYDYDFEGYYKAVTDAVNIIDKYRAESEER